MKKTLLLPLILVLLSATAFATNLKGYVTDRKSGEPLIGATVLLSGTGYAGVVGLDGSYLIKGIPAGNYKLVVQYIGYQVVERTMVIGEVTVQTESFELQESTNELAEVVVAGQADRETDQSVRKAEQKADNVLNIIGAKSIELLPDVTVGNVLQRVSGVSITRNGSGDGQYAIIRGMDKRYNYTLINGIKIPSPDNKNRYVPLDIFPADLLERLEVIKALTPNMEGDAIGGVMNLVMKSAPSVLKVSATAAAGYSDIFNSSRPYAGFSTKGIPLKSPEELYGPNYPAKPGDFTVNQLQYSNKNTPVNSLFNLSVGNTILNHKLGFVVAGSFQEVYRGTNTSFYVPGQPSPRPNPNTYQFQELQIREYSTLQKRLGVLAKLDYALGKNHKLSLSSFYVQLSEAQHRNYHNPFLSGYSLSYDVHDRSRYTIQKIYTTSLKGDHSFLNNTFKIDWTLVYSLATSNTPAWSDINVRYFYKNDVFQNAILLPVDQRWNNNRDEDKTAYLNFTYSPSPTVELSAGGMARFKTRSNVNSLYNLGTFLADGSQQYQAYTSIDKATFNFSDASTLNTTNANDPNNYNVNENITGFYVMGKVNFTPKLQLIGGLRNENTYIEWHSKLDIRLEGRDGKVPYSNFLPSLHVKYALTDKQNLRLSYFAAISRPGFFEYVPTVLSGDYFDEAGNPRIQPATANNFDARYELFGQGSNQLLAGVFYKQINNPIELGFYESARNAPGQDTTRKLNPTAILPLNFGTATNYGFEFVLTKYIKQFGVSANYTYTSSSITTNKKSIQEVPDPTSQSGKKTVASVVDQTRPLQGQSNHIANISLLYKNPKIGLDAQLSWVYTGRRINLVSAYKDLDYWQRGFSQLDFSAEKSVLKKFKVFTKITNLLDTPLITEVLSSHEPSTDPIQDRDDRSVVQKDIFHQTFLAGLRYKF